MLAHGDSGLIHAGSLHYRDVSLGEIVVKVASWDDGTTPTGVRRTPRCCTGRPKALDDGDLAMTGADGMADVVPLLLYRWW